MGIGFRIEGVREFRCLPFMCVSVCGVWRLRFFEFRLWSVGFGVKGLGV